MLTHRTSHLPISTPSSPSGLLEQRASVSQTPAPKSLMTKQRTPSDRRRWNERRGSGLWKEKAWSRHWIGPYPIEAPSGDAARRMQEDDRRVSAGGEITAANAGEEQETGASLAVESAGIGGEANKAGARRESPTAKRTASPTARRRTQIHAPARTRTPDPTKTNGKKTSKQPRRGKSDLLPSPRHHDFPIFFFSVFIFVCFQIFSNPHVFFFFCDPLSPSLFSFLLVIFILWPRHAFCLLPFAQGEGSGGDWRGEEEYGVPSYLSIQGSSRFEISKLSQNLSLSLSLRLRLRYQKGVGGGGAR